MKLNILKNTRNLFGYEYFYVEFLYFIIDFYGYQCYTVYVKIYVRKVNL